MSVKAEEFAGQLLERTKDGKLRWRFVPDPDVETYKADAEDGISFSIKRKARGDDKVVTFELAELGRVVLSDMEDNFPMVPTIRVRSKMPQPNSIIGGILSEPIDDSKIRRFRLYSDLFYAARETAEGKDQAIEKAQQFLARLA
jgi:hypothetical protein